MVDPAALRETLRLQCLRDGVPPFDVSDFAPATPADLIATYRATGRLVIWAGASTDTVWGTEAGNWTFRAWHDWCHVLTGSGFDVASEVGLGAWQAARAESDVLRRVAWVEISEQALYFQRHGDFLPEGAQADFTAAHLARIDLDARIREAL